MKVQVKRIAIEKALYGLERVLKNVSEHSLPLLQRVLIKVSGQTMTLTATDLCLTSEISIGADVLQEGVALPPGDKLTKAIDALKDYETIGIETVEGKVVVTGGGKASFKLIDAAPDDYPDVKLPDSISFTEVKREDLLSIINKVTYAEADKNTVDPELAAIHLEGLENEMRCVSTDRTRLAITKSAMEGKLDVSDQGILLPAESAATVVRLLKSYTDCETIDVGFNSELMVVKGISSSGNGSIVLSTRLIDGKFPDYKRMIPKENCIPFTISKKALISSLRRVTVIAREDQLHRVLLTRDGNNLTLQSENQTGFMSDEISLSSNIPDPFYFTINAKYLLDAVKTISAEDVCISYDMGSMISVKGDGSSMGVIATIRER